MTKILVRLAAAPLLFPLFAATSAHAQTLCCTNVLTYHNDAQRTGWNSTETVLTPATVTSSTFGVIATVPLDDQVDAQPLVVSNQSINGGTHTVVYVATGNNTVYAIDGLSGAVLLKRNLGAPVNMPLGCPLNGPNVGITSTPVIDLSTNSIYVMTYTSAQSGPTYTLHNLNASTLADNVAPAVVSATHTLTDGSVFTFNATYQRQRPALLEANGNIYATFGSFCDLSPSLSRGWVLGWNTGSLTPLAENELTDTQATAPDSYFLASIWMSGYGPSADSSGNIYFVTGNSNSDKTSPPPPNTYDGVTAIQESVVQVKGDLSQVLSLFTPNNVYGLDQNDTDFGAGGVMVLPDQSGTFPHWAVAAGKDGRNFILNRDNMGGLQTPDLPNNVNIGPCWCGASYYTGSDGINRVVTSGGLQAETWKVNNTGSKPALTMEASTPSFTSGPQHPGFFTSVSSNGTVPNTQIVWAVSRPTGGPDYLTLHAYNGTASGSSLTQLWSGPAGTWPNTGSPSNPSTITADANTVPTVANGMVYVGSYQQLWIFGPKTTGSSPWILANEASNVVNPGSGLTVPATGSGNLIAVATIFNGTTSISSVTDNAGNTYASAGARSVTGASSSEIWYAANSKPGATVITPQFTGAPSHIEVTEWEVSGLPSVTVDAKSTATGNVTMNQTAGPPVTTSQVGDFVISDLLAVAASFNRITTSNEFTNDFQTNGNGWAHITSDGDIAGSHQASWNTASPTGAYAASTVAFCSCTPPPPSWTLVNKASNVVNPGGGLTIPATNTGHLLAVALIFNGTTSVSTISDNAGNTYVSGGARAANAPMTSEIWYAVSTKPGATVVTPQFAGSPTHIEMATWEVAGLSTSYPDAANTASGNVVSNNTAGPAVTTSQPGDFVISALAASSANFTTMSSGNNFTDDFTTNGNGWAHITSNTVPPGIQQPSWYTAAPSGIYCASTVAFLP
ncbi:MAG: hypothetical protein JO340_15780 [Acidobacteriaceae bacterium]|nr:hypothetical protein [Acidobacteriaceae bacterium]